MKLYWLLIFVPLAIGAQLLNLSPTLVFVLSFLAMIPLALLIILFNLKGIEACLDRLKFSQR